MSTAPRRTAVITGAASGFGLECSRIAAEEGMNLVMVDVQGDALEHAAAEIAALGVPVLAQRVDVSRAADMEALGAAVQQRFGAPHFVFNNAGVAAGGLIWENSVKDWEWVLGVNLMGVVHGMRVFTPMMLAAAQSNPQYQGHVVNTASIAGMVNPPNMGVYNVTKHGVVSLSESLYQDLSLVTQQVHAHVLCPYFVATGIFESGRNRPAELANPAAPLTPSQAFGRDMGRKAVGSGKVTAASVARMVFEAMAAKRFYIFSHPHALGGIQTRMEDVLQVRNPSDPFKERPEVGATLRAALQG